MGSGKLCCQNLGLQYWMIYTKEQAGPGQSCEMEQDASDLCILSVQNTHQLMLMASRHVWGRNLVSSDAVKADIAT